MSSNTDKVSREPERKVHRTHGLHRRRRGALSAVERDLKYLAISFSLFTLVFLGLLGAILGLSATHKELIADPRWLIPLVAVCLLGVGLLTFFAITFYRDREAERKKATSVLTSGALEISTFGQTGIIALDQDGKIIWLSSYLLDNGFRGIGASPSTISEELQNCADRGDDKPVNFTWENRQYRAWYVMNDSCFYVQDVTMLTCLNDAMVSEAPIMAIIQVDNFQVIESRSDVEIARATDSIRAVLNAFATKYRVSIIQTSDSSFTMLGQYSNFLAMKKDGFTLCNDMKAATEGEITLSIGLASGSNSFNSLSKSASDCLEISLSRGGDQLTIADEDRISYIGGDNIAQLSNRASLMRWDRGLISEIKKAANVFVVPPRDMGFDELGATMGLYELCTACSIPAYWIYKLDGITDERTRASTSKSCLKARKEGIAKEAYEAIREISNNTLIICVGFDSPEYSIAPEVFSTGKDTRVIIISNRSHDSSFTKPVLTLNSSSSSCYSELVAGLLELSPLSVEIKRFSATLLYTGILDRTKNFSRRTTSSTFLAAAFLIGEGAESDNAQQMLRESGERFTTKIEILSNSIRPFPGILICSDPDWKDTPLTPDAATDAVAAALSIDGVRLAFAICSSGEHEFIIAGDGDGSIDVNSMIRSLSNRTQIVDDTLTTRIESSDIKEVTNLLISRLAHTLNVEDPTVKEEVKNDAQNS